MFKHTLYSLATLFVLSTVASASSCKQDRCANEVQYKLEFIGEETFHTGYTFNGVEMGGLSGIDYDNSNGTYIALSDDRAEKGPARFYNLTINLEDGFLNSGDIKFSSMTEILDKDGTSFEPGAVDPESIRIAPFPGLLYWTSEGDANKGIAPFVRIMTRNGKHLAEFKIPNKYNPTEESGIRNNLAFESLTFSHSGNQLFTATENALIQDDSKATTTNGSSVRVLKLDNKTGKPLSEYIYKTDPVAAPSIPEGTFNTNGLVELLTISKNKMIAVERSFSVGVGNSIKLYLTSTQGASDVLELDSIKKQNICTMKKELLLDLGELGITLDNIEGITFGPKLSDGSRTLILVSDNNFNPNGQFTQFLAFKLK